MPTPDFILELRTKVGHDLLWLPGVTAVVLDADQRVLLVRRADTGAWTPVSGILEPGEEPAVAAVREVEEEAGVVAVAERLARVKSEPDPAAYDNGDAVQFLDLTFTCRHVSGEPRADDDESVDAAWFALDDLPPMDLEFRERIDAAVHGGQQALFVR